MKQGILDYWSLYAILYVSILMWLIKAKTQFNLSLSYAVILWKLRCLTGRVAYLCSISLPWSINVQGVFDLSLGLPDQIWILGIQNFRAVYMVWYCQMHHESWPAWRQVYFFIMPLSSHKSSIACMNRHKLNYLVLYWVHALVSLYCIQIQVPPLFFCEGQLMRCSMFFSLNKVALGC